MFNLLSMAIALIRINWTDINFIGYFIAFTINVLRDNADNERQNHALLTMYELFRTSTLPKIIVSDTWW